MAYVNERVPEEEKKAYMIPGYKEITPFCWTIDKEKNIKLFDYWTNIDNPSEQYFAFVWGDVVVKLTLLQSGRDNTVTWNLRSIKIPNDLVEKREEILAELREALRVYGMFGYEIRKTPDVEVVINF